MKSSRLLIAFGAAMAFLALLAAVLVFTRGRESAPLLPESEPAGVVQRYLVALQAGDVEAAQKLLVTPPPEEPREPGVPPKPTIFRGPPRAPQSDVNWRAVLSDTRYGPGTSPQTAEVDLTVFVFRPGAPFSDPVRTNLVTFYLQREADAWRIVNPVDLYWLY